MGILDLILGDAHKRYLRSIEPLIQEINNLEPEFEAFSNQDIREKMKKLQKEIDQGREPDEVLPQVFALTREVSKRTLDQRHYDEQLAGGIALHEGKVIEMKTGEGKTLAATLPAALNALTGAGVHIVTVNDYLARRDMVWMGQIYHLLGLSTGCLNHEQSFIYNPEYKRPDEEKYKIRDQLGGFKVVEDYLEPCSRREAYGADITYGTNNEFGFDYLRDNMVQRLEDKAQRGFKFAILDEVDFILIDEARTPLIISSPDQTPSSLYQKFSSLVRKLKPTRDYEIDEEKRSVSLTQEGIDRVEKMLGQDNIFMDQGIDYLHHLEQALRAQAVNPADGKPLFAKDRDYIVRDGEVIIVDEFTGRLMPGRRWSGGLHQAVEAKERVEIKPESRTMAQITFQNLFRMYDKLSGMTGTAVTAAEELDKVYDLDVICIPTHRPDIRQDLEDRIYKTKTAKYQALVEDIKTRHDKGQPLLVGTRSIEKNEQLAAILKKHGLNPEVLNAKQHEREAQIIAQAGREGALTVATNMAGRGVDIILGGNPPDKKEAEKIKELGGLHVIGTERHEARRIDNQLRGRGGRQGDPGSSQFYLSLEDELLRVFGGGRMQAVMDRLQIPEEEPIQAPLLSQAVESAQKKIEGAHFDARRHVLKYDDVLNRHREVFYGERDKILSLPQQELEQEIINICGQRGMGKAEFERIKQRSGEKLVPSLRRLWLKTMDFYWMQHLEDMSWLKDSVRLRAYGGMDPVVEYKKEGYDIFKEMMGEIEDAVGAAVLNLEASKQKGRLASSVGKKILKRQ